MKLLLAAAVLAGAAASRSVWRLTEGWKFQLQNGTAPACPGGAAAFPLNYNNQQCLGLTQAGASTQEDCLDQCCAQSGCEVYQWCPSGAACSPVNSCWVGSLGTCQSGPGWISGARNTTPPTPGPGPLCTDPGCTPSTNDAGWRVVNLPHDFVVEGNFSQEADMSHGYLPYGKAWYRKHFSVPAAYASATLWLDFEGIQTQSTVYLNGVALGSHLSGYTNSRYWLNNSLVNFGGADNLLAVFADGTKPDGWWYDGGGIYRPAWLTAVTTTGPYIAPWGLYAPSNITGPITWDATGSPHASAVVQPFVTVFSNASAPATQTFSLTVTITDPTGAVVGTASGSGSVPANGNVTWSPSAGIALATADLWHIVAPPAKPALYVMAVSLTVSGVVVDTDNTTFGIRSATFNNATGFYLNGISTKILGTANHQDFAGVGVGVPEHLQWHRIAQLKSFGINGWRTAHNPPTPSLLYAADELGFVVWDENHRNGQDWEIPLLVLRDRNHPSVVIWSLCNEALCQTNNWIPDALRLKALIKELDPLGGRPVSANQNGWVGPNTPLDLQGFDYSTSNYDAWHNEANWIPDISSETSSAVSDRGEYVTNDTAGHVSGYDTNAPGWGQTAEGAWGGIGISNGQGILTRAFMSGGWTWTGWDYRGEPTPTSWPTTNSHFGIIDLCGFWKDRTAYYRSWFVGFNPAPPAGTVSSADLNSPLARKAAAAVAPLFEKARSGYAVAAGSADPYLYVFPHWNWNAGESVTVWAFSNVDEVELFVNGASVGRKPVARFAHVEWDAVTFAPGSLYAAGYLNGTSTPVAEQWVNTTGAPAALRISIKDGVGSTLYAGCADAAVVQVEVVDANGLVVPYADNVITFDISGVSDVILGGTCSGDAATQVNNKATTRPAYHGLLAAVIQSRDETGVITVTASSPGFQSASLTIPVVDGSAISEYWCHQQPAL